MNAKITVAAAVSDKVQEHVDEAVAKLGRARARNGYGVLVDPGSHRANLAEAQRDIGLALALLRACAWPIASDYDQP